MLNNIKIKLNKEVIYKLIFSFLFSWFNISIYMTQHNLLQSKMDYHIMIVNIITCSIIIYLILSFILNKIIKSNSLLTDKCNFSLKKYFWVIFLVHMVAWLPVYLAYYPGLFTYDVPWQMPMYEKGYWAHHPLLHTLYLHLFYYKIGKALDNYTLGIALSTIFQMIVLALSLAYAHMFAYKLKLNNKCRIFMIILSALLPIFPALAISSTKDIFFSAFVIIYVVILGYYCCFKKDFFQKRTLVLFVISSCGVILFRNNGIYPVIAVTFYIFFDCFRHKFSRVAGYTSLLGIAIALCTSNLLFYGLHATKGSMNEALSVPYQQIAGAYVEHKEKINEKYTNYVKTILPTADNYRPDCSDSIKWEAKGLDNLKIFAKTYFKFLYKYPYSYVKAFGLLNAGYLSFTDTTYASIYGIGGKTGLYLSYCFPTENNNVFHTSYAPKIERAYEKLFSDNKFYNLFLLDKLFSPALYFWIMTFLILLIFIKRLYSLTSIVMFLSVLMLTILCGPCCLIRYALPYMGCLPILISCICYSLKQTKTI